MVDQYACATGTILLMRGLDETEFCLVYEASRLCIMLLPFATGSDKPSSSLVDLRTTEFPFGPGIQDQYVLET